MRRVLRSSGSHETGRVLTSNNGSGEYNNKNFRSILAVRGIAFEPCPPQRQHKNGIVERMIGVQTQKARAMMLDSQAPMQFWAEVINTAYYLHRSTPNQSLDGKTHTRCSNAIACYTEAGTTPTHNM